mmetsp:Transcript_30990/g.69764  ORF Transcript_30990/g.69764 Transcript_30990/m.69764 type:complete len:620 (-) Transcript_30990:138-1997(-)
MQFAKRKEDMLQALVVERDQALSLAKEQQASLEKSLNAIFDQMHDYVTATTPLLKVTGVQSVYPQSNRIGNVPQPRRPDLPETVDPVPALPQPGPGDGVSSQGLASQGLASQGLVSQCASSRRSGRSDASGATLFSEAFPRAPDPVYEEVEKGAEQPSSPSTIAAHHVQSLPSPVEQFLTSKRVAAERGKVMGNVKLYIDYIAGVLVLLSTLTMLVELQVEGADFGLQMGWEEPIQDLGISLEFLQILHLVFMFLFVFEWLLRVGVERREFVRDPANWFDTILVIISIFDIYLTLASTVESDGARQSVMILRLMRALKSLRAIRVVRSLRLFSGLRVLVKACTCFLPSLCWSMVLLGIFMCLGALMMGNLLRSFIEDDTQPLNDREFMWMRYGTAYRAWYTLFEITFAGNWPTNVRPVLDKVSHAFVLFFTVYITVVVFAVIRVIGAIFLKETLDAAQNDAEQLVRDRLRMKAEYVQKLESVFMAIDESGNGMITERRLREILENPQVQAYFQTLDLDVHESAALFHLLDNGDGEVTLDEFIDGIMRCKGGARAIDQVAMHADIKLLDTKLSKLARLMKEAEIIRGKSQHSMKKSPGTQANHLKVFRIDASAHLSSMSR